MDIDVQDIREDIEDLDMGFDPNEEFPAPPDEFLEDIRAVKKQEEIEGPLDDSGAPSPPDSQPDAMSAPDLPDVGHSVFDLAKHFERVVTATSAFSGTSCDVSLNSSFTESSATENSSSEAASWSPGPSPLPSPSPSMDSACSYQPQPPTRFHFPPLPTGLVNPVANSMTLAAQRLASQLPASTSSSSNHQPSVNPVQTSKGIVIALTGVTLANCDQNRDAIYGRLARASTAINNLSGIGGGTLPRAISKSSSRPPDYQTAMQRLCLMKNQNQNSTRSMVNPVKGNPVVAAVNPIVNTQLNAARIQQLDGLNRIKLNSNPNHVPRPGGDVVDGCGHAGVNNGHQVNCDNQANHNQVNGELEKRARRVSEPAMDTPTVNPTGFSDCSRTKSAGGLKSGLKNMSANVQKPGLKRMKKKVSFSDHVELVAHSADIEEVHLPNPLLDRILGKSYLANNNINNG